MLLLRTLPPIIGAAESLDFVKKLFFDFFNCFSGILFFVSEQSHVCQKNNPQVSFDIELVSVFTKDPS